MKRADILEGLDSTLTLVHHYLKGRIKLRRVMAICSPTTYAKAVVRRLRGTGVGKSVDELFANGYVL